MSRNYRTRITCVNLVLAYIFSIIVQESVIQLDWPWIAEWAYAGIFAVAVRFQNQDQYWISHQKSGFFIFLFFRNVARTAKKMFLAILAKIRSLSNNSDM